MAVKIVKLSLPEEMAKLLEDKARKIGLKLTPFCTNLIFEYARREAEK